MDDFVPTRAAKNKKNAKSSYVETTYETYKKVQNTTKVNSKKENPRLNKFPKDSDDDMEDDDTPEEPIDERRKQELDMKRYRYDVIKFGMSGFDKQKAREAKIALAISLGAKPPKNKRINYKRLQKERKVETAREKKREKFASGFNSSQLLMKNKNKDKSKFHNKKDKESSGILGVYGKVTKDKHHRRKGGNVQKRKS